MAERPIEIHGLRELLRKLETLPKEIVGKGASGPVASSTRVAANVYRDEAQRLVPKKRGRLWHAIKTVREKNPSRFGVSEMYHVGVDLGRKRDDPKGAWYWWFVERGTRGAKAGQASRGGKGRATSTGKKVLSSGTEVFGTAARGQPAQPYLRPAAEKMSDAVILIFQVSLGRRIVLIEKKLGAK